ncbi:MAG: glycoside hydrolase family protein [Planctomycetota bacterium]
MNRSMRLVILIGILSIAFFRTSTALCRPQPNPGDEAKAQDAISFDVFASFKRIRKGNPVFACKPPEWAAAAHAIVTGDTIHYLWARRKVNNYWMMMHSTAPVSGPATIKHDPRNPVLLPSKEGFDDFATEYPFPFWNPADRRFYVYYLGRQKRVPKQTGLLVGDGDFGRWTRVRTTPVIAADTEHERKGSSHPSVAVVGDTIHIIYTGESTKPPVICHATAPTSDPATVTKDPANPIFEGTGQTWDSSGVREAEIFKGPRYFHILYGGSDGKVWRIGHVRTRDFRNFEPNPHNPIFTPPADRSEWDCDGILTPQVFEAGDFYYMLYAGKKGKEWQTGLAKTRKP